MPNYKKMYFKLYRAHSKVLAILRQVTLETEEMAMDAKEPVAIPAGNEIKAGESRDA